MNYDELISEITKVANGLKEDNAPKCGRVCMDAVAAIKTLLSNRCEWISVEKELPERWDKYLCVVITPCNGRYTRSVRIVEFDIDKNWVCPGEIISHWMPCPLSP